MPTLKQKLAFKEAGVNGGCIGKAMIKAGYSDRKGNIRTDKLTKTIGWQELIEKHLSDRKLAKVHEEGLSASKEVWKNNNETGIVEKVSEEPDYAVRHKYLDLAYKVKGKIQDILPQAVTTNILNVNFFSNPKIKDATAKLDEAFKDYLTNGDENKEPIKIIQAK